MKKFYAAASIRKSRFFIINLLILLQLGFISIKQLNAQWTHIYGPVGIINTITSNGTYMFAGGYSGIFVSSNNGVSWFPSTSGLTNTVTHCIVIKDNAVFAATEGGVFESDDNGATWVARNNGLTNLKINTLTVTTDKIYAGTDEGVFISTDNAGSWDKYNFGLTSSIVYAIVVDGTNIFAATNTGGICVSTDNCQNWYAANFGLLCLNVWTMAKYGNDLYAGTTDGLFISSDHGVSWQTINNGLGSTFIRSLLFSGALSYAGTYNSGIYLSSDHGENWTDCSIGLQSPCVLSLAMNTTYMFAGLDGAGLWRRLLSQLNEVEELQNEHFSLCPNPITTTASLTLDGFHRDTRVRINDLTGRSVYDETFSGSNYSINRGQIECGLYQLSLWIDDKQYTQNIIIQ